MTVSGEWMVSLSFKDVKETIRSADLTEARRQLKDYPWDIYCSITMSKKTVSSFFHVQRKHTWIYTLWILKHKRETSRDWLWKIISVSSSIKWKIGLNYLFEFHFKYKLFNWHEGTEWKILILLKNPYLEGLRQEGIMTRYLLDLVRFDIVLFFGNSV